MKKFFPDTVPYEPVEAVPTILLDCDSDGSVKAVCVESILSAMGAMDFSDFALSECLKHGVSYKSLQISPDLRIGSDIDFDELDKALENRCEELFVSSKN